MYEKRGNKPFLMLLCLLKIDPSNGVFKNSPAVCILFHTSLVRLVLEQLK